MVEKTNRPALGQKVKITGVLERKRALDSEWANKHIVWSNAPADAEGIYIGYRTVFDGRSVWIDEEVGYAFAQEAHHEVWLVVTNARRNPIRCRPDQVIVEAQP